MYSVNLMHIFGIGSRKFRMFDGESDRESESAKRKFVLSFQCSSYPTSSPPTPPLHQRHGASLSAASVSPHPPLPSIYVTLFPILTYPRKPSLIPYLKSPHD